MPKNYTQILTKLYFSKHRLPTYREFMIAAGLHSTNAVHKIFQNLTTQNIIKKDAEGKLYPGQKLRAIPLLGNVSAGFPSAAEEELVDTMTLEEYLIPRRDSTYLLRVDGDSMIDAGLMPGDLVLAERNRIPRSGDIVVAEVDHAWTLKYFQREDGRVALIPGNKKYHPIYPREELKISAVVVSAVRKYK